MKINPSHCSLSAVTLLLIYEKMYFTWFLEKLIIYFIRKAQLFFYRQREDSHRCLHRIQRRGHTGVDTGGRCRTWRPAAGGGSWTDVRTARRPDSNPSLGCSVHNQHTPTLNARRWSKIFYILQKGSRKHLLGRQNDWCFFSFSSSCFYNEISELPRPINVKLCHVMATMFNFVIKVGKISGALPPKKNLGAKTCKIKVDFGELQTLIANISGTGRNV